MTKVLLNSVAALVFLSIAGSPVRSEAVVPKLPIVDIKELCASAGSWMHPTSCFQIEFLYREIVATYLWKTATPQVRFLCLKGIKQKKVLYRDVHDCIGQQIRRTNEIERRRTQRKGLLGH